MELNEKLAKAVEESGMKQSFIASKVGMSDSVFSSILTGRRNVLAQEYFEICDVIHRNPEEVYKMQ